MGLFDLPVEELYNYKGITPCPVDLDEFWDRGLKEIESIDKNVEFVKVDFPSNVADLYDMYFTGTKGARIHCQFAKPKKIQGRCPAVLRFHGLFDGCAGWYSYLGFVAEGFVVAMMDARGQGGTSEDVGGIKGSTYSTPFIRGVDDIPQNMYYYDVFLDTVIMSQIIMGLDYVDETRVGCYGGSQGGGLSIACAALNPKISRCYAEFPYLSDYKRVWELDLAKDAYDGLTYYFRHFDPNHEREEELFTKLGYIDIQNLAKRVKAKVMMLTGLMDKIVPPSTQFAMYNKLECDKNVILYPEFGHENLKNSSEMVFDFMMKLI